jgi:glucuronate isomerase
LPAFRPDKAMNTDNIEALNTYINSLEGVTDITINSFDSYLTALKNRHDYFAANGCSVSDHGLEEMYAEDYTEEEIKTIFNKIRTSKHISYGEALKFKSAMLFEFAIWDHEKGWCNNFI